MKVAQSSAPPPRQIPSAIGRVSRRTHRSLERGCRSQSSLQDTPETALPAGEQYPQQSASSESSARITMRSESQPAFSHSQGHKRCLSDARLTSALAPTTEVTTSLLTDVMRP